MKDLKDVWQQLARASRGPADELSLSAFHIFQKNRRFASGRRFLDVFLNKGFHQDDARLSRLTDTSKSSHSGCILKEEFLTIATNVLLNFEPQLTGGLIIPIRTQFRRVAQYSFEKCKYPNDGNKAAYIHPLSEQNEDLFALSIVTVDGQYLNIGDNEQLFSMQSISKVINFSLLNALKGDEFVSSIINCEGSGRPFNDYCLSNDNLPYNCSCNLGALYIASHLFPGEDCEDRVEQCLKFYQKMAGNQLNINTAMAKSEYDTGARNKSLIQYLNALTMLPIDGRYKKQQLNDAQIKDNLMLYMKLCSTMATTSDLGTMAAVYANGGVSPTSGKRIISHEAVKNSLAQMSAFGLYEGSGKFKQMVGNPAKSGVAGGIFLVIPNIMGIALFSPKLDTRGNSVRGVKLAQELVRNVPQLHPFFTGKVSENEDVFSKFYEFEVSGRRRSWYRSRNGNLLLRNLRRGASSCPRCPDPYNCMINGCAQERQVETSGPMRDPFSGFCVFFVNCGPSRTFYYRNPNNVWTADGSNNSMEIYCNFDGVWNLTEETTVTAVTCVNN